MCLVLYCTVSTSELPHVSGRVSGLVWLTNVQLVPARALVKKVEPALALTAGRALGERTSEAIIARNGRLGLYLKCCLGL